MVFSAAIEMVNHPIERGDMGLFQKLAKYLQTGDMSRGKYFCTGSITANVRSEIKILLLHRNFSIGKPWVPITTGKKRKKNS